MNFFRAKSVTLTLITLGLVISGYLLWRHLLLSGAGAGAGQDICQALFRTGCDASLMRPEAHRFGLPLAGWGVIFYATLAVLIGLAHFLGDAFEFEAHVAAFLLSLGGVVTSLRLGTMMLTQKGLLCPLCVLTHIVNLALFISLWRLQAHPVSRVTKALRDGLRYLATGRTADPVQARWKLLASFMVLIVALALYQRVLLLVTSTAVQGNQAPNPQQLWAAFQTIPEESVPVAPDDATLGPAGAPVEIVVFSEFECPACERFAEQVHALVGRHAEKIRVVFKHFPLGKACNRTMKIDLHPQACEAAFAAEAARRQGAFWPFHDELFAGELGKDANRYTAIAKALGLDLDRFEADRADESTKARVRSDIELGSRLQVEGTPALFLNRRRILNLHPRTVSLLVDRLLATTPPGP